MSTTLGEKLRQAREARGISISEVAEQTRISGLYLQSIENDDYRTLPGGIFNKGFVKSYARYVGIDEQEALQDYTNLIGTQNLPVEEETKTYRPQVLTNDNSSSTAKTIIFAAVIIGLGTFGILTLVHYLQDRKNEPAFTNTNVSTNSNVNLVNATNTPSVNQATTGAPTMNDLKIELKAVNAPVYINSVSDGTKDSRLMSPDKPLNFEPKENLKIGYSKSLAKNVQFTINGKQIATPLAPANPKRNVVEFEITKDNLAKIWQDGKISFDDAGNVPANAPR
ncbi:MAG: helix-turn-helix domain-containing protein [Acidobacteriota bacterium]|nr:helix-turn-helix domain-containing protein [Acidobacteriota bacterium]